MKVKPSYLTKEGIQKLKLELEDLIGPRRNDIALRLKHAVEMGDLSENADYIQAKEEQGFIEGRIQEVESLLKNVILIQDDTNSDTVTFGVRFVISIDGEDPETYRLVGATEANPRKGMISDQSPIGKAVLGKYSGDTVQAQTPAGTMRIDIKKIL